MLNSYTAASHHVRCCSFPEMKEICRQAKETDSGHYDSGNEAWCRCGNVVQSERKSDIRNPGRGKKAVAGQKKSVRWLFRSTLHMR